MIQKALLIFFSIFFFACSGSDEVKIPDTVLSKEKMAKVVVDIHLLEATLNLNAGMVDKNAMQEKWNIDIYKKHHITKQQYIDSYAFYTKNPDFLVEVYDIVLQELSKLQASVGNSK